ncbi:TPA: oligosaccharide flippase family protein, partial [Klebsiella pneumoniae]|nr:oligosaccharide flippase family protein [Klebsiella pneumoniae]
VAVYNNAILKSKINTICNVIGLVTSLLIRYVIVLYKLDILFLSLPIILVTLVPYLLRRYLYRKEHSRIHGFHKAKFRNKLRYSKYMFMAGIPLAISSVSVIIYARITQFVIMHYGGDAELGIFSVASQLATAWMFITTSIITSYYSKIYAESNKDKAALMVAR